MSFLVPACRIERDGGGNRHIQAFAVLGNIDPHQPVAMAAGEMAEARPLGPHHDAKALDLVKRSDITLAVGGEARDLDAGLLKPFDGARQVDHSDHRNTFQRACRRAGQRA